jgi:hypothetical protein
MQLILVVFDPLLNKRSRHVSNIKSCDISARSGAGSALTLIELLKYQPLLSSPSCSSSSRCDSSLKMRRTTRKVLIHLGLFSTILFLIIYLNGPQSKTKTFAWNEIRYKPSSVSLPKSRGLCPGLDRSSKPALVVSRVAADGDPKWLDTLSKKYHLCVYTVDASVDNNSKNLQVPANRGHEAMAYLTFMIDNYDHIPTAGAVFVHGARFQWHNDEPEYDNAVLLGVLNIPKALEPLGYHNLRCDWSLSTCPASSPPQGSLETSFQAKLVPWDDRAASDAGLPKALVALFGGRDVAQVHLGTSDAVRSQCCAQFVVSRESIFRHSREEYVALRQWLLEDKRGDLVIGRILSYVWHILFIKQEDLEDGNSQISIELDRLNKQACPNARECYCRLYGRCDLESCTTGACFGQYKLPQDLKLPKDWAETHG